MVNRVREFSGLSRGGPFPKDTDFIHANSNLKTRSPSKDITVGIRLEHSNSERTQIFSLQLAWQRKPTAAKESLDQGERGSWKSWLKTQHSWSYL